MVFNYPLPVNRLSKLLKYQCVCIYIYKNEVGIEVIEGWNAYENLDVYLDFSWIWMFILLQEFVWIM